MNSLKRDIFKNNNNSYTGRVSESNVDEEMKKYSTAFVPKKRVTEPNMNSRLPWDIYSPKTTAATGVNVNKKSFGRKVNAAMEDMGLYKNVQNNSQKTPSPLVRTQQPQNVIEVSNNTNTITINTKQHTYREYMRSSNGKPYVYFVEGAQQEIVIMLEALIEEMKGKDSLLSKIRASGKKQNIKKVYVVVSPEEYKLWDEAHKMKVRRSVLKRLIPVVIPNDKGIYDIEFVQVRDGGALTSYANQDNTKSNTLNTSSNTNVSGGKGKKSSSKSTKSGPKIHTGPNGGKYYIKSGKKVYLK
jgi:hypothetical protein